MTTPPPPLLSVKRKFENCCSGFFLKSQRRHCHMHFVYRTFWALRVYCAPMHRFSITKALLCVLYSLNFDPGRKYSRFTTKKYFSSKICRFLLQKAFIASMKPVIPTIADLRIKVWIKTNLGNCLFWRQKAVSCVQALETLGNFGEESAEWMGLASSTHVYVIHARHLFFRLLHSFPEKSFHIRNKTKKELQYKARIWDFNTIAGEEINSIFKTPPLRFPQFSC